MWGMSADNNKMDTRVADIHQRDSRSATVVAARYALAGAAYLAVYAVLDRISLVHGFQGLGISLWTPAVGFTMAVLLTRGFAFAPLFLVAVVFTDVYVHALPRSVSSIMVTGAIVTLGYSGLVWVLQRALGFDLRQARLRDIVILMVAVPTGIMVISFSYCAALYLMGLLPADQFWNAVGHFWVGDTVGTVIVLPAMMAGFASVKEGRVRFDGSVIDTAAFLLGLAGAFAMIFGPERTNELQFFYLLFLPVMWIAIRVGFVGAALGLLVSQVVLVVIAKFENIHVEDFMAFQMLMLALSATGLLLGAMVTERREAEDRLREQQAELSRMSRYATAGAMGLSVAHQISQPLSTVATYLHAAARLFRSDRSDPIAIVAALEKAEAEAERAREVLERIRDFLSRGRLELTPVDLVRLVSRIAPTARAEAATRGVQIKIEGVSRVTVKADPIQIEQVLLNLITNAVKYTPRQGRVTFSSGPAPDDKMRVVISDTGPGIPPDKLSRIFTPFDRLGAEQSDVQGTGLGLALSKRLMHAMGGSIGVTSDVGRGSTFWVELASTASPLQGASPLKKTHATKHNGALPIEKRTVLYIEDNLSNLTLIEQILEEQPDIELMTAMQGAIGVDLARQHSPDLILLDLHLPDMPGWEVLAQLKGAAETRHIPTIVISADATTRQIDRLMALGASAYLTKPLNVTEFVRVLEETASPANGSTSCQTTSS